VQPGDSVAVLGCGGVGINVIQGAVLAGAERVIAIDALDSKLEMATRFGATHTVNAKETDTKTAVFELTDGRGADVAFEVVGAAALQRQVLELTRRGGTTVFVGVAPFGEDFTVQSFFLTYNETRLLGCWYGSCDPKRDIPRFLRLWQAGRLNLEDLISDRAGLDDVNAAFEAMEAGKVIRTVLTP
ncbi:MAG TPA: zinc-binding dehydrogenase, partial [Actinomycetota bacterium]|nr:zinc-binding dehydrogenase [Actinomycetota bacterium]